MKPSLRIDPYDPFDNPTQYRTYAPNYNKILPQVDIPGYEIPLHPTCQERKRIRHYFNAVGLGCLSEFLFIQMTAPLLMMLISLIMHMVDTSIDAETYLFQSSMLTALNGLLFLTANVGVAWIGCRATKIPVRSLIRTSGFGIPRILQYLAIGIFLQCATGYVSGWITDLLGQSGIAVYEPEMDFYGSGRGIAAELLYGCLIAPITEEFLYRGFVLKNLSRVSQRTGIVLSALIFGLVHQNLAQFVLAFTLGLFLGEITVRHNSILPAIFVHICVNTVSTGFGIGYTWLSGTALEVFDLYGNLLYLLIAGIGLICWFFYFRKFHFPCNTPKQSVRGLRLVMTSPWLLAAMGVNLLIAIYAIAAETMA